MWRPRASGSTRLVEQLTAAPVQQRKKLVLEYLRNTVAEVTRIDASEIREEAGFFDLGMDSLMAVELRRRLEQAVGKELPATLAMDFPRLSDVADYLLSDVLNLNERAGSQLAAQPTSLATSATDEPIAIIAVACRFPGSPDADAYWDVLSGGVDAIREIPEDRFDVDEFYDPDQQMPGKIYTRSGGYLDSVDGFDPEFFGISPREAVWIDPQQRLMLEIGLGGPGKGRVRAVSVRGSRTGVFVGVGANEYSHLLSGESVENLEAHFITGNALNAICRPGGFHPRSGRTGDGGGHRLQLVAGGRPSGQSGSALGRLRHGAGRWRQRLVEPGVHRRRVPRQDAGSRRPMQDLRRGRRRLRAR